MVRIVVAGIGVDVGKTITSAILTRVLHADYWKPISCSHFEGSDRQTVEHLLAGTNHTCHREAFSLPTPVSPHEAAQLAGIEIQPSQISLPTLVKNLVIEMVGGILVPLNTHTLAIDLFKKWECHWVLVSKNYLGSINHTLLTVEALRKRGIEPLGIVFNGKENIASETFLCNYTQLNVIGRIKEEENISPKTIERYSDLWKKHTPWNKLQS